MFVCLFVCVYWTSKTAEPIAPKSHITPGKENGCSELQKIVSIFFDFCKILKIHEKNNNSAKIDIIVLLKRNCWKVGQQLKVEIVDGREASWYTNIYIYIHLVNCLYGRSTLHHHTPIPVYILQNWPFNGGS